MAAAASSEFEKFSCSLADRKFFRVIALNSGFTSSLLSMKILLATLSSALLTFWKINKLLNLVLLYPR